MTTPIERISAVDPEQALLLVDVDAGKVWQDAAGYNWHERRGTRLRQPLRELGEARLVELAPADPAATSTRYRAWRPTAAGGDALDAVKAALAEAGLTLDDVRQRFERLRADGVL